MGIWGKKGKLASLFEGGGPKGRWEGLKRDRFSNNCLPMT